MKLIQLKVPPDKLERMADAIERDLEINRAGPDAAELRSILVWLRYRHSLWTARHPAGTRK